MHNYLCQWTTRSTRLQLQCISAISIRSQHVRPASAADRPTDRSLGPVV